MAERWTRIWWVRPVRGRASTRVRSPSRSHTSTSVAAPFPVAAPTPILARLRSSAASTRKRSCSTLPRTRARYRRSTSCRRNIPARAACVASSLATTMRPDVPASNRWTIPGRSPPPRRDSGISRERSLFTSVPTRPCPGGRLRDHQQVVLLIGDGQRARLGGQLAGLWDQGLDAFASGQAVRFLAAPAVDQDQALGDRPLDVSPGYSELPRDHGIEPTGVCGERGRIHLSCRSQSLSAAG